MENAKQYLVIGGSDGIGLAISKQLLASGHKVTVLSRTNKNLVGMEVSHIQKDILSDGLSKDDLPDTLDGLVYCPGSIELKPFRSFDEDQFRKDFEINLVGAVKSVKAALRALKAAELPSIVLFSTVAVGQGMPFHTSIAAAKGAVEGFTRALAAELAPNIRVNCIAPSLTDTSLARSLLSTPERREASAQRHPLRRIGQPEDIAEMACFLLSDKSKWISGQILGVDGGLSTLRN